MPGVFFLPASAERSVVRNRKLDRGLVLLTGGRYSPGKDG